MIELTWWAVAGVFWAGVLGGVLLACLAVMARGPSDPG
jgi:hypothetical protein